MIYGRDQQTLISRGQTSMRCSYRLGRSMRARGVRWSAPPRSLPPLPLTLRSRSTCCYSLRLRVS